MGGAISNVSKKQTTPTKQLGIKLVGSSVFSDWWLFNEVS